ncbi:hypothetical protein FisN_23Hh219 [Fistulifera solaris]|uniref:Uncharacterized protein n=1 Tax=Fistulifera solaris TaxID=1519565 RepID=A0A1Z5JWB0_FISSO|nr:hypothetical protein FisN_23Lh219 [Fistulifera solaris]GAX18325.1 hypothetical protein FisN_23Hh219 [Fistulifera solaris]|eukprot:GAX16652.1 hypothetical protein FisN_23Lh219 [Fistulifera solaris]
MARVLFFIALIIAAASAFVAPASNAVSSPAFARTSAPKMTEVVMDVDMISTFAQNANVIATSSGDFGGAFYPVAGLTLLGALILYLSPPLADE